MKSVSHRGISAPMFPVALFTIAKIMASTCVYWYVNGKKMWYIHKVLFSFKTEHPVTCYSKDESQWYYTKWNKPGTERQMVQDLIYMWILKQLNSQDDRIEWC